MKNYSEYVNWSSFYVMEDFLRDVDERLAFMSAVNYFPSLMILSLLQSWLCMMH